MTKYNDTKKKIPVVESNPSSSDKRRLNAVDTLLTHTYTYTNADGVDNDIDEDHAADNVIIACCRVGFEQVFGEHCHLFADEFFWINN